MKSRVHRVTNGVVLENFKIKIDKKYQKKFGFDSEALTMISVGRNHVKRIMI